MPDPKDFKFQVGQSVQVEVTDAVVGEDGSNAVLPDGRRVTIAPPEALQRVKEGVENTKEELVNVSNEREQLKEINRQKEKEEFDNFFNDPTRMFIIDRDGKWSTFKRGETRMNVLYNNLFLQERATREDNLINGRMRENSSAYNILNRYNRQGQKILRLKRTGHTIYFMNNVKDNLKLRMKLYRKFKKKDLEGVTLPEFAVQPFGSDVKPGGRTSGGRISGDDGVKQRLDFGDD